ncbi:MAG: RCC1 domain-containing protein, partial [Deltaproteobacteria bacterium]|nr:RCC1 domain-containing protein [Deltaproteobacteria bacterium]
TNRSTPVPVRGLSGVTAIALGSYHSCAITQNPTTRRPEVLCWGRNNVGELGDGTTMDRTTPVMVMGP